MNRAGRSLSLLAALALAVVSMSLAGGTRSYSYDELGRLVRVVYEDGTIVDWSYDLAGNVLVQRRSPTGAPANTPPGAPSNPGVPDGASDVATQPALAWTVSDPDAGDVVVSSLYLGMPGDERRLYSGTGTNYTPDSLRSYTVYNWHVEARDSRGAVTVGPTWSFTTGNAPPIADFSASPRSGAAPLTVSFTDLSTSLDDPIVLWNWDFEGEGTSSSSERNPIHAYPVPGTYTVVLTVSDGYGLSASRTKTGHITVYGDDDSDGINDGMDNCPGVYNPSQSDRDHDGIGDACDPDIDGDGVANGSDNCPFDYNPDQADSGGEGIGNACRVTTCVATSGDLAAALGAAGSNGKSDVIRIVQGVLPHTGSIYEYTSDEPYDLLIKGGYAPGCTTRTLSASNTVLDGQSGGSGLSLTSTNESSLTRIVLEGFTVRRVFGTPAATIASACGRTMVQDMAFLENQDPYGSGGGLVVSATTGSTSILRTRAQGNAAFVRSGLSVTSTSGAITIADTTVLGNTASGYAAGIAVSTESGVVQVVNDTVTANTATPDWSFAGGLLVEPSTSAAQVFIENDIVRGNGAATSADVLVRNTVGASITISRNDLGTWIVEGTPAIAPWNLDADPLFVDAGAGDVHLADGSPCIDAGDAAAHGLPSTDFEGDARVLGYAPDIGADEYHAAGTTHAISGTLTRGGVAFPGETVRLSGDRSGVRVTDAAGGYRFAWLPAGHYTITPDDPYAVFTPAQRSVTLGVTDVSGQDFAAVDRDTDLDGVPDRADNCRDTPNPDQLDTDQDGLGDACDIPGSISGRVTHAITGAGIDVAYVAASGGGSTLTDATGAYTISNVQNGSYTVVASATGMLPRTYPTPVVVNPGQDTPGIDLALVPDSDNDGIGDPTDNCPGATNYDQADLDRDGTGDVCDADLEGDGIPNVTDVCPRDPDPAQVDSDGDGFGDACTVVRCVASPAELQAALNEAPFNDRNDVIELVQGTYRVSQNNGWTFSYSSGEPYSLVLRGGYTAACAGRTLDPANTVLDGEGLSAVASLFATNETPWAQVVVEGLTLRGGVAYSAAGLDVQTNAMGIAVRRGAFADNHAEGPAGGLRARATSGAITVDRVRASGNSASSGAGMALEAIDGRLDVTNSVIAGNTAMYAGGGLWLQTTRGNLAVVGDTVTANVVSEETGYGGGVDAQTLDPAATLAIRNTIVRGNAAPSAADLHVSNYSGGGVLVSHNDVGAWAVEGTAADAPWNFDLDPRFVDPANGNYHVASSSPCIDVGDDGGGRLPQTDMDGDARTLGVAADIGADEYKASGTTHAITGRVTRSGAGLGGIVLHLTGTAAADRVSGPAGAYTIAWLAPGSYTVTPSDVHYTFVPASRFVVLGASDVTGQDFVATLVDTDGDGVVDAADNCLAVSNPDQHDGDGDGFGDACDCAPSDPADPPHALGNSVVVTRDIYGQSCVAWDTTGWSGLCAVYRGTLVGGSAFTYNHACFGQAYTAPVCDATSPEVDVANYYLVSRKGCSESSLGNSSSGTERPNPAPCP